jgi:hypothetical protein
MKSFCQCNVLGVLSSISGNIGKPFPSKAMFTGARRDFVFLSLPLESLPDSP